MLQINGEEMWTRRVVTWTMPKSPGHWLNEAERFREKDRDLVHFRPSVLSDN